MCRQNPPWRDSIYELFGLGLKIGWLPPLIDAALPYASKLPKEAVMGAMYAVAAAAGMVILTQLPHAEGHMTDLMFGSLLGASWTDLAVLAGLGTLAVLTLRFAGEDSYVQRVMFYLALALAVVPAIHAVGIVLVFGMLLLPALAAWQGERNGPVWLALLVSSAGAVSGVFAAETLICRLHRASCWRCLLAEYQCLYGTSNECH